MAEITQQLTALVERLCVHLEKSPSRGDRVMAEIARDYLKRQGLEGRGEKR